MLSQALCFVWGHAVHNSTFARQGRACTRCRRPCLQDEPGTIRVGHTLSCFLRHHTYERVGERDGHTEYACLRCGHPLLFPTSSDPYRAAGTFPKRVRYLCGLVGHRVHRVTERDGGIEYACHCGHSFVHQPRSRAVVHHPMRCVLLGHWVAFVGRRAAFSEYACCRCGHPFLFARAVEAKLPTPNAQRRSSKAELQSPIRCMDEPAFHEPRRHGDTERTVECARRGHFRVPAAGLMGRWPSE